MSKGFNVETLVQVAIVDERSGEALYLRMAEMTDKQNLKELFQRLAKQEVAHRKRFEKLLEDVKSEPVAQYSDEYADFLEILAGEGGKSQAHNELDKTYEPSELIDLAITFEREQLALQQEIAGALGEHHRKIGEIVIQEERDHIVRLFKAKKELKAS